MQTVNGQLRASIGDSKGIATARGVTAHLLADTLGKEEHEDTEQLTNGMDFLTWLQKRVDEIVHVPKPKS